LVDLVQSILVDVLCISWSVGHTHTENAMIQGELQFHCDVLQTENLFCQLHLLSGKYLQGTRNESTKGTGGICISWLEGAASSF